MLKKCHKLVQRVCAAFASLGNVTAKAAFRLLRLLFVCTFSKHYVIYRPVKNLVRLLFTWTVFTDFWLKLLLLFPRAAVGVIQWLWFKERGVSCPQSELLFFFLRENAFPVLVLTSASYLLVFNVYIKELESGVISPLHTFSCKHEHMKLMCFSTCIADNKTPALTMLCWLPRCCMCIQSSASTAATAKTSVPIQAGDISLLLDWSAVLLLEG